jgi:hypothetical protein
VELAPDTTATTKLTEMLFGGGARVRLDSMRPDNRTRPYASAGAGLWRQEVEDSSSEQGTYYYVGGGILYGTGPLKRGNVTQGVRADVQWLMLKDYFGRGDELTRRLSVTGGIFFSF